MVRLDLPRAAQVVCIGAHCDDIEIGCGGTLATLAQRHADTHFHCWVFSGDPVRGAESRQCLARLLGAERFTLQVFPFRDGYLPQQWGEVKERLAQLAGSVAADLVFTHAAADAHQDHRLLSELTWNHFRRQPVLEYEIPKYEGDLGRPNLYVPLSASALALKVEALLSSFVSQHAKPWFTAATFEAVARLRGIECVADAAEAFLARKLVVAQS